MSDELRCPDCNSLQVTKKNYKHYMMYSVSVMILGIILGLMGTAMGAGLILLGGVVFVGGIAGLFLSPVLSSGSKDYKCQKCEYSFDAEEANTNKGGD